MAIVWFVWWIKSVRKCSRSLKSLPYLSTRYRQVIFTTSKPAFATALHFSSLLLPTAVVLLLRLAQPMARHVHAHVVHLRLHTTRREVLLRIIPRLQRLCADGLCPPSMCRTCLTLGLPQVIVTVYFSIVVLVSFPAP